MVNPPQIFTHGLSNHKASRSNSLLMNNFPCYYWKHNLDSVLKLWMPEPQILNLQFVFLLSGTIVTNLFINKTCSCSDNITHRGSPIHTFDYFIWISQYWVKYHSFQTALRALINLRYTRLPHYAKESVVTYISWENVTFLLQKANAEL